MSVAATNEHIGKMAALPLLERLCEIESLPPATSPICWTLQEMQEMSRPKFV